MTVGKVLEKKHLVHLLLQFSWKVQKVAKPNPPSKYSYMCVHDTSQDRINSTKNSDITFSGRDRDVMRGYRYT